MPGVPAAHVQVCPSILRGVQVLGQIDEKVAIEETRFNCDGSRLLTLARVLQREIKRHGTTSSAEAGASIGRTVGCSWLLLRDQDENPRPLHKRTRKQASLPRLPEGCCEAPNHCRCERACVRACVPWELAALSQNSKLEANNKQNKDGTRIQERKGAPLESRACSQSACDPKVPTACESPRSASECESGVSDPRNPEIRIMLPGRISARELMVTDTVLDAEIAGCD